MTPPPAQPMENNDALFDLVDRYIYETLSDEEFKRLEKALQSHRPLRDYYRQSARLDAGLGTLAASLEQGAGAPLGPVQTQASRRHWIAAIAAIAILTLICSALLVERWHRSPSQSPVMQTDNYTPAATPHLAVLTHAINATWTGKSPIAMGAGLGTDRLQASEGLFQIDFRSGVTLVAQAPLDLELIDPMQVHCRQGTLRLQVPYHARGFRVLANEAEVVDKGTEFGMTVSANGYDLQVFDGEVEIREANGLSHQLLAGQGWTADGKIANKDSMQTFPGPEEVVSQQQHLMTERFKQWTRTLEEFQTDTDLRLLYAFDQPWGWDRRLINLVPEMAAETEGVLIGSQWSEGRWPGKRAIEFKQVTDSIRIHDDRELHSLTLMTWIRIDGFDRTYNSLMTSDGWEPGCIHWQFRDSGRMDFGIKQSTKECICLTEPVLGQQHLGRWIQLAVTYDHRSGRVTHYLNGTSLTSQPIVNREPINSFTPFQNASLRLGSAQLGNWNTTRDQIRNLNGRMDFFALWSRVLSPAEIQAAYAVGRPQH